MEHSIRAITVHSKGSYVCSDQVPGRCVVLSCSVFSSAQCCPDNRMCTLYIHCRLWHFIAVTVSIHLIVLYLHQNHIAYVFPSHYQLLRSSDACTKYIILASKRHMESVIVSTLSVMLDSLVVSYVAVVAGNVLYSLLCNNTVMLYIEKTV